MVIITRCILLIVLYSSTALAKQCDINLIHGVIIDPAHIRIVNHSQTYVQINGQHQLFVHGSEIKLNAEQKKQLATYSSGIRKEVPAIVSIAIDGLDLGLKAVNKMISGLTGENSAAHQQFQKKLNEMKSRLRTRFNHSAQNYYIAPQDFDDFDEIFTGEFEKEIEVIISNSVGTILTAVSEAMTHHDEKNSEQRLSTYDERIGAIANNIKLGMTTRTNVLDKKSEKICARLIELNNIEHKLQLEIPALSNFDLIQTN